MKKSIALKGVNIQALIGAGDTNLRILEDNFSARVVVRGNKFHIDGEKGEVEIIGNLIHEMSQTLNRKGSLTQKNVQDLLLISGNDNKKQTDDKIDNVIFYGRKGGITARTKGQKKYVETVRKNDIVFSIGPAGTGKTYIAVAFAVSALENHDIDRIILCRPAVEAGENLGFLPGDLKEKVDPYLTPLYDALGDMLHKTRLNPLLAKNTIEIIPLAYMRGRTLNNAFLILDEAQNATPMQMKMFLTRLGVNSKAIITGDITQIDLPNRSNSGLLQVLDILNDIDGIGFCQLDRTDVVRHQLVKNIIDAYNSVNNHESTK
ncbi:MAG TPA: PhoH family protein [Candidatus Marinimicrobia bacterium]|jgi:phosphate starvation-inducible PhoH-like protein|nr:PhoH family protein [Candidatus Neomarinimicrobiota bacterium]|tara:strand:+ start:10162 stop:11118 length:957 start_codon:yes stop_codon:yes gene_type:complete